MIVFDTTLTIDGIKVNGKKGETILEVAKRYGINIPTLCFVENLPSYGACRLCVVEISKGKNPPILSASCTYDIQEGLVVNTKSERVVKARKILAELLVASAPNVKIAQDIAARCGVKEVRFKMEDNRCVLCGICVRMCHEQMGGEALGFVGRGIERKIQMPFNKRPKECLLCRGCEFVCPAMEIPCQGVKIPGELCGRCLRMDEMPYCCTLGSFGCSCDHNPLASSSK
jgi:NADH dehydrogenase/NADH:ubiquinone oxidoreductase subunit G